VSETQTFDEARFYLGSACKRGHLWGDTDKSLRYKGYRACVECQRERNRNTGGQRRAAVIGGQKLYVKALRKRARVKNRIQEPYTYEDLQARLRQFDGQCAYCGVDVKPCVHCGESRLAWDHFDPNGPDALCNLVPACRWCN
jgi:hypothetical protein